MSDKWQCPVCGEKHDDSPAKCRKCGALNRADETSAQVICRTALENSFAETMTVLGKWISPIWSGKIPLVKMLWVYHLLGGLAILVVGSVLVIVTVQISHSLALLIVILGTVVVICYEIVTFVGVWRSAGKYDGPKKWAVIARIYIVLEILGLLSGG
jgi:hypothetical protein